MRGNHLVCSLSKQYNQFVLEFNRFSPWHNNEAAFAQFHHEFNSWTKRKAVPHDALLWHRRLGHPGPGALEHLTNASQGVRIRGPTTAECSDCAQGKMARQPRRAPREHLEGPGERLGVDFHDFEKGWGGLHRSMYIIDRWCGMVWDFYMEDKTQETIWSTLKEFFGWLKHKYNIQPKVIECDNEVTQHPNLMAWLKSRLTIEPSAPHTQAQNGAAERSGGVIKDRIRTLRLSSKLPGYMWPEISKAVCYLLNRTPRYALYWKSPYEVFHTRLSYRNGVQIEHRRPDQSHLRAYGCRAYAMTAQAQEKKQRLQL